MTESERQARHDLGNERMTVSLLLNVLQQWSDTTPHELCQVPLRHTTETILTIARKEGRL